MVNKVGEFEKVSLDQFYDATKALWEVSADVETPPDILAAVQELYDHIQLPSRATAGSAGYDIKSPFKFTLRPGASIKIPTGIRVRIDDGWWLGCLPRSGLGFKYRIQLDNTMGVIDSDYYGSDNDVVKRGKNEGHIFAKVTNDSKEGKLLTVNAGDGFLQAIFIPYGITYSDSAKGVRNGGMGSTGA